MSAVRTPPGVERDEAPAPATPSARASVPIEAHTVIQNAPSRMGNPVALANKPRREHATFAPRRTGARRGYGRPVGQYASQHGMLWGNCTQHCASWRTSTPSGTGVRMRPASSSRVEHRPPTRVTHRSVSASSQLIPGGADGCEARDEERRRPADTPKSAAWRLLAGMWR
jgi:hypothetical protein